METAMKTAMKTATETEFDRLAVVSPVIGAPRSTRRAPLVRMKSHG
jgi:hypothetical protein